MRRTKKILAGTLCSLFVVVYTLALVFSSQDIQTTQSEKVGPKGAYGNGWNQSSDGARDRDDYLILDIPHDWRGSGAGKTRLLHDDWLAVHKTAYVPRDQGRAPSCVGQAVAAAVDFLAAVEIHSLRQPERAPPARASAATIYGYSRQEIGELGTFAGGGSHNLWAVQAIQRYGVVAELRYGLIGVDLRQADPARCISYGMDGVPDSLDFVAKLHPVRDYIAIDSYEELRDAMVMGGCPVVIGSKQGFGDGVCTRDAEGFLVPPKRRWFNRGSVWNHSMVVIGVCDEGRPGVLFLNSWGEDWVKGPTRFKTTPKGCFWVDAEIVDRMVKQGDSFAIRGYKGYARYNIWKPRRR